MENVSSISLKDIPNLVEEQKNIALHAPVYVFCTDAAQDSFRNISDQYCNIYQNQELFSINKPEDIDSVLASAIPRNLIFFLYKSGRNYWKKWLDTSVNEAMMYAPNSDLYSVEIKFGDNEKLGQFGVTKIPCVLVYKMGYLIDRIYPEHEEGIVHDQIEEYNDEIAKMIHDSEANGENFESSRYSEAEKLEFEQRYREKEAKEKRKYLDQDRKHLIEVKKKIEQDKLERQRKYGKKG